MSISFFFKYMMFQAQLDNSNFKLSKNIALTTCRQVPLNSASYKFPNYRVPQFAFRDLYLSHLFTKFLLLTYDRYNLQWRQFYIG